MPGLGEALTCLALRRMDFAEGGLPREVAALARLRRLLWCPTPQPQFALGYQWGRWGAPAALPAGPWLASLQQAVLSSAVAAASLRVLAAAPQLRELVTVGAPFYEREQCREQDVALWAAARPPPALRRVTLNIDTTTLLDYHRLDLLQQLQHCAARARSAVDIQVVEAPQAAAAQEPLLSVAEADAL